MAARFTRLGAMAGLLLALPVRAATPVTFYRQIAPIIYQNCSPCHRPGESGPFPLLTYDDVRRHAQTIAEVTRRRYMPPWLPEPGHGDFQEERRLRDAEIQLIQDWVKQGAPAGSPAHAPRPPKFTLDWQLGKPDLVLHIPQPYELGAEGPEIFWNFIIPVPVTTARWVRAMEIRPGNARVFHHANVVLDRSRAARRQEKIPGLGFPGMDLALEEETFDPDSHFLSWKPGSAPVVEPDGMAWRAEPGMDIVLNVHLKRSGKKEKVDPVIGLYFTDKPQTKYAMLVQLEHDGALDIPAGARDFLVTDEFRTPLDLLVLAVYPHAHYLGKLMEGYATLPDGKRQWLIRIPEWDLNWQGVYRFRRPVRLPRGSLISMRYHYDNSAENVRNPNHPPGPVHAGNEAVDEMGHLWLQVLPQQEGDQRAELQEAVARRRLEKYPADFSANYILGDLLLSRNDPAGAATYFEAAVKADPFSVLAATELGVALFTASRLAEAEQQFKRALAIDPKYTDARFDLASVEAAGREWEAAAGDFKQVLTERPHDAKAQQHLGEVLVLWGDDLARTGHNDTAVMRYRDAVVLRPSDAELRISLGTALAALGRFKEARPEFEAALRIVPNSQPARQALKAIQALGAQ